MPPAGVDPSVRASKFVERSVDKRHYYVNLCRMVSNAVSLHNKKVAISRYLSTFYSLDFLNFDTIRHGLPIIPDSCRLCCAKHFASIRHSATTSSNPICFSTKSVSPVTYLYPISTVVLGLLVFVK